MKMIRVWIFGAVVCGLLIGAICQKLAGIVQRNEPIVAKREETVIPATPISFLKLAKPFLNNSLSKNPREIKQAKALLGYIKMDDKDYPEAKRLLAKFPSDKAIELSIKKLEARNKKTPRQKESSEAWSKERLELELALHPERKEQMAREVREMHDAIKEKHGAAAALKFLQGK